MPPLTRQNFHLRTFRRVSVQGDVEFLNEALHGTGRIWNVSVSGCRVDGSRDLKRGIALSLVLRFPHDKQALVVDTAVVAWTRGREVGLRFEDIAASHAARLQHIIRSHHPEDR